MKIEQRLSVHQSNPSLTDAGEAALLLTGFLRDQTDSSEQFLGDFRLLAAEALNNAVEHGCREAKSPFFEAEIAIQEASVTLRISDPSDFPGWEGPPELPEDPFAEGGRGHFLIASIADTVAHEQSPSGHVLVLTKNFPRTVRPAQIGGKNAAIDDLTAEVMASYEMIDTLISLGEMLATADGVNDFVAEALRKICEVSGAGAGYIRTALDEGLLEISYSSGLDEHQLPRNIDVGGATLEAGVFRTGEEVTLPEENQAPAEDPLAGWLPGLFITPVVFKGSRRGILVLGRERGRGFFDAGHLKIARVLAEYLGITLALADLRRSREAATRATRELEIAAEIQLSLTPESSDLGGYEGLEIEGICRPALQAGGDYFDVVRSREGRPVLIIADVMGKGLPAAIVATMFRSNFRAAVSEGIDNPSRLLTHINALMFEDLRKLGLFITAACITVNEEGRLDFAGAGHPAALLRGTSGETTELISEGMPLGILHDNEIPGASFPFGVGDFVIMQTDGITEASGPGTEMFGMEGLGATLANLPPCQPSGVIMEKVLRAVETLSAGAPPSDDRTLLVMRRLC